jgi:hypothetical protein
MGLKMRTVKKAIERRSNGYIKERIGTDSR